MKILLSIFLISNGVLCFSQDLKTSTILWKASSMSESPNRNLQVDPGTIVTYNMQRVDIKDNKGAVLKSYELSNPVGDLQDAGALGRIRYRAKSSNGEVGTFAIEKRERTTMITLSFAVAGAMPREYHYDISSTTAQ